MQALKIKALVHTQKSALEEEHTSKLRLPSATYTVKIMKLM
jgi:hypothetical protein